MYRIIYLHQRGLGSGTTFCRQPVECAEAHGEGVSRLVNFCGVSDFSKDDPE